MEKTEGGFNKKRISLTAGAPFVNHRETAQQIAADSAF